MAAPAQWRLDDPVWLTCEGTFNGPPYGLYEALVVQHSTTTVGVRLVDGTVLEAKWNTVPEGTTVVGCQHAGAYAVHCAPQSSVSAECTAAGSDRASLSRRDAHFPASGHRDMTNMSQMNNAELARNLQTLYEQDVAYCRCAMHTGT